jgi:hypothetical protein
MLPIDPRDGQDSVTPAQPARDILPDQAMAHGGTTIIRPGAVAWGGQRDTPDRGNASCEAIERSLSSVARDPDQLPGLIAELAWTQLWVPLPLVRDRPFTDGTAVLLPLVRHAGLDFVPCFTCAARLAAWAEVAPSQAPDAPEADAAGQHWRRAGDARVVPHIVVSAVGLARRLPPGLGLVLNPDASPSVPLYPECVSYLARLTADERIPAQRRAAKRSADPGNPGAGMPGETQMPPYLVGHPPAEPAALLREASDGLRTLPGVGHASRAWLSVPGAGEGLVLSVTLDDPGSEADRSAVAGALERACAAIPLRVPFPVDVTFPGEAGPDALDDWIARNTRPFYTRDERPQPRTVGG